VTKEVLTMDTGLGHGRCAVLDETDDIDPLGDDLGMDHKVDLGVNLVVGLSTVRITLSKLCCASTQSIDTDLSIPGVGGKVENITIPKGAIPSFVVHWT
jgi:hypothetical protein